MLADKPVQDSVVDVTNTGTQLEHTIAQKVGPWPPKLVSEFFQQPNQLKAFSKCSLVSLLKR